MIKSLATMSIVSLLVLVLPAVAQDRKQMVERGAYLMNGIAACANCHMPRDKGKPQFERGLSGGGFFNEKPFTAYASNLTSDTETVGSAAGLTPSLPARYAKAFGPTVP